jgi:hypothetical protein
MNLLALIYVFIIEAKRENSVTTNEALSVVRLKFLVYSLLFFRVFSFKRYNARTIHPYTFCKRLFWTRSIGTRKTKSVKFDLHVNILARTHEQLKSFEIYQKLHS